MWLPLRPATEALFLAASGLRIGEALAIKWSDFKNNVLHVTHKIYKGDVAAVKSECSEEGSGYSVIERVHP